MRRRHRSPSMPPSSSITASDAASPAMSSASCRKSRTLPFPKRCAWSRRNSASRCPRPVTPARQKPGKRNCAANCSTSTSVPARFSRNACKRPEGAHAREYLTGRGLDDETIATFRIGYAPDSGFLLRDRAAEANSTKNFCARADCFRGSRDSSQPSSVVSEPADSSRPTDGRSQLTSRAMYSKFRNRVMFPIANEQGRVIAFTGRTLVYRRKSWTEISELARDADLFEDRACCSIWITPKKPSASSTTPSWSKARWTASPSSPPDSTM